MGFAHERIAQIVVLIGNFESRLIEFDAFFHAVSLGERTCGHITHDDFQRQDLHCLDQSFSIAQLLDQMSRNTFFLQDLKDDVGHGVVDNTLACDLSFFLAVKCCGVVLIIYDECLRIVCLKYFLCLAFIKLF